MTEGTSGVFAGDKQCIDKSDEHNQLCGCEDYEWPCQDGDGCIPLYSVCDGTPHCQDYSDQFAQVCHLHGLAVHEYFNSFYVKHNNVLLSM